MYNGSVQACQIQYSATYDNVPVTKRKDSLSAEHVGATSSDMYAFTMRRRDLTELTRDGGFRKIGCSDDK